LSDSPETIRALIETFKRGRDEVALAAAQLEKVPGVVTGNSLISRKVDRLVELAVNLIRITEGRYRVDDELYHSILALKASARMLESDCTGREKTRFREEVLRVGLGIEAVLIPVKC
jgi:hypothetical protein